MKQFRRNGDVNLHEVKEAKGKVIKHNGTFVLARGEATGSIHSIKVKNPQDMIVQRDDLDHIYITLTAPAELTHTNDHETTTIFPAIYIQVPEREKDWFAEGIVHKVVD